MTVWTVQTVSLSSNRANFVQVNCMVTVETISIVFTDYRGKKVVAALHLT